MKTDTVVFSYPEEAVRISNWHNVVVPLPGDRITKNGKIYVVDYRIFDPSSETITIVLIEK